VAAVGRAGYLALMFPGLYRGPLASPGLTRATVVSEEAAFVSYAVETTIATSLSCAFPLYRHASPPVRERYLPGIVEGREIGAICVTEPGAGSDIAGMQTTITYDKAAGEYVVSGSPLERSGRVRTARCCGRGSRPHQDLVVTPVKWRLPTS
jgi:alkylation response protein AidB-like acyl-CoA dehydrogenase